MQKEYIKQLLRDSKAVKFCEESSDFLDYVKTNYIDTGKCLKFRERSFFDDEELVLIITSVWKDDNSYGEFLEDPMLVVDTERLISYNIQHKIRLLDIIS
jgi:hypothetical protein